jgi:hypothetical protein
VAGFLFNQHFCHTNKQSPWPAIPERYRIISFVIFSSLCHRRSPRIAAQEVKKVALAAAVDEAPRRQAAL